MCRRQPWLGVMFCGTLGQHTPTSSVVSKPDTRGNAGSLRRHPSLSPSAVLAASSNNHHHGATTSVGISSTPPNNHHHYTTNNNTNGLLPSSSTNHHPHHFLHHNNAANASLVTDTLVTSANSSPLHHAHVADVVNTHHQFANNINNHHHPHHHPVPKHSHSSSSPYSDQILVERPNNFSVPTSPSLSSSQTSSSAGELNTSFGGAPHQDVGHMASYQNFLAFRAQQLDAAQIYASPPGTPMSQLYDTAGPVSSAHESTNLSMDPRYNLYNPCTTSESPHLYMQPQNYPRPPNYSQRSLHELPNGASPAVLNTALSSANPNGIPRSVTSSVVRNNYHNISDNNHSFNSVPASPEDGGNHLNGIKQYPLVQPRTKLRNLQTNPHNINKVADHNLQQEPNEQQFRYLNQTKGSPASKFNAPIKDGEILMC